ncbi:MAG: WG repeat-containing protein [Flavobacteriales bacterium]
MKSLILFFFMFSAAASFAQDYVHEYEFTHAMPGGKFSSFKTDSTIGIIDSTGKKEYEIKFDRAYNWSEEYMGFLIRKNNKLGFFHMDYGLVLPIEYETDEFQSTFNYDGNLYFDDSAVFCLRHITNKWGLISMYGKIHAPFEYDKMFAVNYYQADYFAAEKDGKWGVIDRNGKTAIEFTYDACLGRYHGGRSGREEDPYVFLKKEKIVFYSLTQKKEIPEAPPSEYDWESPSCLTFFHNNKAGVVDRKGNIIIDFMFDNIFLRERIDSTQTLPTFLVYLNGKAGLIIDDRYVFPLFECDRIDVVRFKKEFFYILTRGDKKALYTWTQLPITDFLFDDIYPADENFTIYSGTKSGTMTATGVVTWNE